MIIIVASLGNVIFEGYRLISQIIKPYSVIHLLVGVKSCFRCLITAARLFYLTGLVHGFQEKVDEVEERLIDYESVAEHQPLATRDEFP